MYYIYEITNLINGKTYIGQRKCPQDISPENDKYMGSGKHLKCAKLKYGLEFFSKKILISDIDSKEEANIKEIEMIELYKKQGKAEYNIAKGGDGGDIYSCLSEEEKRNSDRKKSCNNYWLGKHLPKEMREKISRANTGKKLTNEQIERLRNVHIGKKLTEEHKRKISESNKGRVVTEETRKKISEKQKGKVIPEEQRRKLSLANKGHKNSPEARRKISVKLKGRKFSEERRKHISEALKGKGHPQKESTKEKISKSMMGVRSKKVICVETGIVYESLTVASRETNIRLNRISDSCRGNREFAGGYHWRYA